MQTVNLIDLFALKIPEGSNAVRYLFLESSLRHARELAAVVALHWTSQFWTLSFFSLSHLSDDWTEEQSLAFMNMGVV